MLRTPLIPVRQHVRSLSLFENVKKILGRSPSATTTTAPTNSSPTTTTTSTSQSTASAESSSPLVKVGQIKKSRVIGYDISTPERLSGPALTSALDSVFSTLLGSTRSEVKHYEKFTLTRRITKATGRRVPDVVLNAAKTKRDIIRYFEKEDGQKVNTLQLSQDKLPINIRVSK